MRIGELIKKERLKKGLSQSELAALCGWNKVKKYTEKKKQCIKKYDDGQRIISCYEVGRYRVPLDRLFIIAKALNISSARFISKLSK